MQGSVDEKDVHCPLMVGNEYVRRLGVKMLAAFHFYG